MSEDEDEPPPKRLKNHPSSPISFVTWNCNGLTSRCRWNNKELIQLLKQTNYPDMICLQEVRLKAKNSFCRDQPSISETGYNNVKDVCNTIFIDYDKYWSLADNKYAGTLTLIHKRLNFYQKTNNNNNTIFNTAFTPSSAICILLKHFHLTLDDVNIPDFKDYNTNSDKSTRSSSSSSSHKKKASKQLSVTKFFTPQNPSSSSSSSKKPSERPKKTKQLSVTAFFSPKKQEVSPPSSVSSTPSKINSSSFKQIRRQQQHQQQEHNSEGRFQFFFFDDIDIIQTYVPNNGMKEESFQRRREWDKQILNFILARQSILSKINKSSRPLLWCGDLNVAKDYRDGTHWERKQMKQEQYSNGSRSSDATNVTEEPSTIYEWWTDESKCLVTSSRQKQQTMTKSLDDTGIPSFTPAERRRFKEILNKGKFVDIWRELHPNGVVDSQQYFQGYANNNDNRSSSNSSNNERIKKDEDCDDTQKYHKKIIKTFDSEWDKPNYTWRGHLGKNDAGYMAKYQGKGQRLDYFLLSPKPSSSSSSASLCSSSSSSCSNLPSLIQICKILGYGERREGLFCGSDHCASLLKFNDDFYSKIKG